jgi:hypothetical protein
MPKTGLPVIHCRCGAEILVVPDVKEMGRAIETHVASCRLTKQSKDTDGTIADLRQFLIAQVLNKAAEEP